MAVTKIYGSAVTNKYNSKNYTWKDWTWVTIPDNYADPSVTSVTITWAVKFCFTSHGSSSNLSISGTRAHASLTVNGSAVSTFNQGSTTHKLYGGEANAWQVITYSKTVTKTNQPQTITWSSWCKIDSGSTWKGTSSIGTQSFTIPALPNVEGQMKINGAWETGNFYIKESGAWNQAKEAYVKINGAWQQMS